MSKHNVLRNRKRSARHIARLFSGNLGRRQAARIGRWRSAEPGYRNEFQETLHLLSDMEVLADSPDIRALVNDSLGNKAVVAQSRSRVGWGVAVAASLLLVAVVGFQYFLGGYGQPAFEGDVLRYVTRIGERKTVQLKDGSEVTLNTGSELLVRLDKNARRVTLDRGEAFFVVADDPQRPFSVDIDTRSVSVLGTAFNIRKNPGSFTLAVLEGVVSLHRREEQVDAAAPVIQAGKGESIHLQAPAQQRLKAGWVAEFDTDQNTLVAYAANNISRLTSWRDGLLSFQGEPLYKVVQEINRYTGKKLIIEDATIMDLKIYAALRVDGINSAIATLDKIYPIKVVHYFDHISIVGEPPAPL